jgi:hypothetical protein
MSVPTLLNEPERTTSCTSILVTMKFASAVPLAFVASVQAAVTSSRVLPSRISGYIAFSFSLSSFFYLSTSKPKYSSRTHSSSGLALSSFSLDTTAAPSSSSSVLSSLSAIVSSESSAAQSVLPSASSLVSDSSPTVTLASALSSSSMTSSAPAASSSSDSAGEQNDPGATRGLGPACLRSCSKIGRW